LSGPLTKEAAKGDDPWAALQLLWTSGVRGTPGPIRRAHHAAVTVGDTMLIYGGHNQNYDLLGDLHLFDFNTSKWSKVQANADAGFGPGPRAGKPLMSLWV
jgi:hypothetical protein